MQADKLERLRERMVKVRELFRDTDSTEFVIVTIPTVISLKLCPCLWFICLLALSILMFKPITAIYNA